MTNIEKGILGAIAVCLVVSGIGVIYLIGAVEDAGGLNQVVIDAGREVKHIAKEINKE